MKRNQTLSMILMLTAASGMALAAPEKKQSDDKDLLRGPAVVDSTTTNKDSDNWDSDDQMMKPQLSEEAASRPIVMRELVAAIRTLSSERSGNQLNLSPEQDSQLKVITEKFRTDMQAFQQENRDTIRELRDKVNAEAREQRAKMRKEREANAEKGEEDNAEERQAPQQSEHARKLRELIENSPASKTAMASIKKVLSEEQMTLVKETIMKTRERGMGNRAVRPGSESEDGMERETPRRQIDGDRVRPEQRRQRDQKNKNDKPIDD